MNDLDVRIEKLGPIRIASFQFTGPNPEEKAWEKLCKWAEQKGLLDDIEKYPIYGFNNPRPSPEGGEYGYEFWIHLPDDIQEDEAQIKDFEGGLFAVTTCKLIGDPKGSIPEVWKKLWDWVQASEYEWIKAQELEKPHKPITNIEDVILDLYLPIK